LHGKGKTGTALRDWRAAAALIGNVGDGGAADQRCRQLVVGEFLLGWAQQERIRRTGILGGQLMGCFEIPSGNSVLKSIQLDDAFRQKIADALAGRRNVSGKHVIEAAIFANDDDDVLDFRLRAAVGRAVREGGAEAELAQCQCAQS